MLLPVIGLCVGIVVGLFFPGSIPDEFTQYTGVAIVAIIDCILAGIRKKIKEDDSETGFLSSFIFNAVVAVALTYIGNLLGMELYIAVIVFFGVRMLQNIEEIRIYLLKNYKKKDRIKSVANQDRDNSADLQ